MLRKNYIHPGWNGRNPNNHKVLDSTVFTKIALPFSYPFYTPKNSKPKLVPPEEVLGGKYYNLSLSLNDSEAINLMNMLDDLTTKNDPAAAHYIRIGKFGYYVPSEGKNRVSLYRKYNRKINALVSHSEYPSNTQLTLVKVRPFGLTAIQYSGGKDLQDISFMGWLVISSNPLTVLLPYEESVQFFENYNVKYGKPMTWLKAPLIAKMAKIYATHHFYIR